MVTRPLDREESKMAGHGHGGCGHEHHDHEHDETPERGLQFHLYTKIDFNRLQCLNEAEEGSAKNVFKPWDERLEPNKFVESDVDEELLFNIPFTGNVKLKGEWVDGYFEECPSPPRYS